MRSEKDFLEQDLTERKRLQSLYEYQVLDTGPEKEFDELTRLAAEISNTPISRIHLINEDRQWPKAKFGGEYVSTELPRNQAVCRYTIQKNNAFEVKDLSKDPRFSDLPYVAGGPKLRYYYGVPLIDPRGYAIGALCVLDYKPRKLTDTQKRQLQIVADEVMARFELRKKNTELEKLNEHKVALMKMLSHDMRSPLNGIIGMSSLLKSEVLDENQREVASLLEQSAMQLNQMIDEIMSYSLIESKGFSLNPARTDLDTVVSSMMRLFTPVAQSKNIELAIQNSVDTEVDIDRSKFEQIFGNLLSNALKFTNAGGLVTGNLELLMEEGRDPVLQLQVRDSGIGMDDGQISRLFEGDRDISEKGTSGEKSTGIGLSIIKHFVELHSGNIEVSSRPGSGTLFTVKLPAFLPENETEEPICY
jgi:two-component system, sensor histidine kinase